MRPSASTIDAVADAQLRLAGVADTGTTWPVTVRPSTAAPRSRTTRASRAPVRTNRSRAARVDACRVVVASSGRTGAVPRATGSLKPPWQSRSSASSMHAVDDAVVGEGVVQVVHRRLGARQPLGDEPAQRDGACSAAGPRAGSGRRARARRSSSRAARPASVRPAPRRAARRPSGAPSSSARRAHLDRPAGRLTAGGDQLDARLRAHDGAAARPAPAARSRARRRRPPRCRPGSARTPYRRDGSPVLRMASPAQRGHSAPHARAAALPIFGVRERHGRQLEEVPAR